MRVAIGLDHAGFHIRDLVLEHVVTLGHEVIDEGAYHYDAKDDFPDFAEAVADRVASGDADRGVVVCGSGVGACIAANKVTGIRAGTCHDTYSAHQGVEHDDMNILCIGSRIIGAEVVKEVISAFLSVEFINEEKYQRRLKKVLSIEARREG